MNYRIVFADGKTFNQPEQMKSVVTPLESGREWRQISVIASVDKVKEAFIDGAEYRQEWDSIETTVDEDGNAVEKNVTYSRDLSEFAVAGEVVDHRDGIVTVLMGKTTEIESMAAREAEYIENLRALGVEV